MNNTNITEILSATPTSVLCSAHPQVRAMYGAIAPLFDGAKFFGPAKTVKINPGENAAIHRAAHTAKAGDILVIEAGGDQSSGPFGELLATSCQHRGVAGMVIDGTVRDVEDICRLGFPVFCLGACPAQTKKSPVGDIDIEISCAGVAVRPGDYIAGDADGVVVIPKTFAQTVAEQSLDVKKREQALKIRIANGETTFDIFEIGGAQ